MQKPMPLPLPADYQRCLAHGLYEGDTCFQADNCARHVTLRHDRPHITPMHRACLSENMVMYLPMEGFPDRDAEDECYGQAEKSAKTETAVPAIVFYPAGSLGEEVPVETCTYPRCTCPFDAPADPNWCARGLPHQPKLNGEEAGQ